VPSPIADLSEYFMVAGMERGTTSKELSAELLLLLRFECLRGDATVVFKGDPIVA
jgi:hypothetical protein